VIPVNKQCRHCRMHATTGKVQFYSLASNAANKQSRHAQKDHASTVATVINPTSKRRPIARKPILQSVADITSMTGPFLLGQSGLLRRPRLQTTVQTECRDSSDSFSQLIVLSSSSGTEDQVHSTSSINPIPYTSQQDPQINLRVRESLSQTSNILNRFY